MGKENSFYDVDDDDDDDDDDTHLFLFSFFSRFFSLFFSLFSSFLTHSQGREMLLTLSYRGSKNKRARSHNLARVVNCRAMTKSRLLVFSIFQLN